jgi:hypothetical protein
MGLGGETARLSGRSAALAPLGCSLLLATNAGLLVVLTSPGFGEDAVLLDALREALQRGLEGFVFSDDYFGQTCLLL